LSENENNLENSWRKINERVVFNNGEVVAAFLASAAEAMIDLRRSSKKSSAVLFLSLQHLD
jgi:hypothetical protein